MTLRRLVLLLLLVLAFTSCKKNRLKIDVSGIETNMEIHRFEQVMLGGESLDLAQKVNGFCEYHPQFCELYFEEVIRVGNTDSPEFENNLLWFVSDTVYRKVADDVLTTFSKFDEYENAIKKGFKHYRYYFPNAPVPDVYTYFSGLNESIVVAEDFVGISLDKYLGADCVYYQYMGIPIYKARNMNPQKMITDIFYAWALTEFPKNDDVDNLLSNMIFQGKLLYFTEAMNPTMHDSIIIGFTGEQIKWCNEHEAYMWAFLAEKGLLFTSERLELRRYVGDGPFTNTFSQDSPGRTGVWLGWQIVRSFMNKNPEVSLAGLFEINNAQEILNQSGYFPE